MLSCRMIKLSGVIALCLVVVAPALHAQEERLSTAFDLGLGAFSGHGGGDRATRSGVAITSQVIFATHELAHGALQGGMTGSSQHVFDNTDDCVLATGTSSGGCLPNFPNFNVIGAIGGWTAVGRSGVFRALAGPVLARAMRTTRPGFTGRVDVATPELGRTSLVAWGESTIVPNLGGQRYTLLSFGLGLRLQ